MRAALRLLHRAFIFFAVLPAGLFGGFFTAAVWHGHYSNAAMAACIALPWAYIATRKVQP